VSFLNSLLGDKSEQDTAKEVIEVLSSNEENIAILEPATSGLVSYRLSRHDFTSQSLSGSAIPASKRSYEQFISLDEVQGFPHKQVSNNHDAQLLANRVREVMGSNHGLSVIAPLDGTTQQTVFVGVNIGGRQAGVFSQDMNFHKDDVEKKVSEYALRCFLEEYSG
jgi:nicotinamide mononucleotide (NMN) deamidase PncC